MPKQPSCTHPEVIKLFSYGNFKMYKLVALASCNNLIAHVRVFKNIVFIASIKDILTLTWRLTTTTARRVYIIENLSAVQGYLKN